MANRLADSLSPYLRQHADNPVDWREWDDATFAEARERDVPVFLSVGYAACHWCHVMAHDSFEDEQVAQVLRDGFVSVKVDREERPDVDAVYMRATLAMTGQGGWPMTCLLTPSGDPFFAGTYLPKAQLLQLLAAAQDAWTNRRDQVVASGANVAAQLSAVVVPTGGASLDVDVLDGAAEQLARQFDWQRGGFGGAPKFPPSMVLEFLLRQHARAGDERSLRMVDETCEAMARGGLYDQLDGGFARYSVDADWVVPHFEKMLYDNAQLMSVYAHLWRLTGSGLARRVALETADFVVGRLGTDEGAFASALDADTDGAEGATYAWTPAQLVDVLGEDDGARAADLLRVTTGGTFEHGTSTLQLREEPSDPAWWERVRRTLAEARDTRPQPARDDKVVTSWNGLAITGLVQVGMLLERPDLVEAARRCARYLLDTHLVDGRLRRTSLGGRVSASPAVADDHGNLAQALLTLHQADGDLRWVSAADDLLDTALAHFRADDGGFHDTADDAEALFARPRDPGDNAEPSGQSSLAHALITAAALSGSESYRAAAEEAVGASAALAGREPRFTGWTLAAAEALEAGPVQVAVSTDGEPSPLSRLAWLSPSPGLVTLAGREDTDGTPLLASRPLVEGRPTAYVCRGFVCDTPRTDVDEVKSALGVRATV